MKIGKGVKKFNDLDEFMTLISELLGEVENERILIEAERTGTLSIFFSERSLKLVLGNWTCVGVFNMCTRKLFNFVKNLVGLEVLSRIFDEFNEFLKSYYQATSNIQGLITYPFSLRIVVDKDEVKYQAVIGSKEFKKRVIRVKKQPINRELVEETS